jgi:hypothetical protein
MEGNMVSLYIDSANDGVRLSSLLSTGFAVDRTDSAFLPPWPLFSQN